MTFVKLPVRLAVVVMASMAGWGVLAYRASAGDAPATSAAATASATATAPKPKPTAATKVAAPAKPPAATSAPVTLLELDKPFNGQSKAPGTVWRYFETIQTDICRTDAPSASSGPSAPSTASSGPSGELVRVDPMDCRQKKNDKGEWVNARCDNFGNLSKNAGYRLNTTTKIRGTPWPAGGWQKPDFDDSRWVRYTKPGGGYDRFAFDIERYRSLALICLRGRFEVADPAAVTELNLTLTLRGGAVVYLNGQEIGRGFMPAGAVQQDTPAQDYPKDAYVDADGDLLPSDEGTIQRLKDEAVKQQCLSRIRTLTLKVPIERLRKGVNVLAVEIHRSPAPPAFFTAGIKGNWGVWMEMVRTGGAAGYMPGAWWDRAAVMGVKLTAAPPATAATPNIAPPKGLKAWYQPVSLRVNAFHYGDPNDPPPSIRVVGARNGAHAGQVILTCDQPIQGLSAVVTDLKSAAGSIAASAVEITYPRWVDNACQFGALEPTAPKEVAEIVVNKQVQVPVMQPVWLTVQVPPTAAAGEYSGKLTLAAQGQTSIDVPVSVKVAGEWVMPDPKSFVTYVAIMQSPESLSLQYKVPMWSEEHWKLLDKAFQLLGRIGTNEVHIGLQNETALGNPHTMVQWVKQADGSYKPDMKIVERYIDTASKYLRLRAVCCALNYGRYGGYYSPMNRGTKPHEQTFTVVDPKTGELTEQVAPAWGTPEALAFWKPVFDGLQDILKRHNLSDTVIAFHAFQSTAPKVECWQDIKELLPNAKLVGQSHLPWEFENKPPDRTNRWFGRHYMAWMQGAGVFWEPDEDKPYYGWREPLNMLVNGRDGHVCKDGSSGSIATNRLSMYRTYAEKTLFSGIGGPAGADPNVRRYRTKSGFGIWGADFWPEPWTESDKGARTLMERYFQMARGGPEHLLEPGLTAPVFGTRLAMLRESLQETEAHVFLQNVLLDQAAKLTPDLAKRCKDVCDDRVRFLRFASEIHYDYDLMPYMLDDQAARLFEMAGEVAKAVGKN